MYISVLGIILRVELLGHRVCVCPSFGDTAKEFSKPNEQFMLKQLCVRIPVAPHPHRHFVLSGVFFCLFNSYGVCVGISHSGLFFFLCMENFILFYFFKIFNSYMRSQT